ncbi:MBL fold metallo-hydrolase [Streptomyces turgidiscabies]|uniref:Metallo-beta-lactamase domain protein n=1 Tax=Streptomyces turgidiscabies (strain Car8) TaxID=698760 RepID=L7ET87_STRT8|nr:MULTISPECIES: MBL fold metallo-hydrolase [Streptomyces]ELP62613.1 metallo-beta-lactamase domain protein [Streptomyces turgidiscabies Car8]MDX3496118.1 MBL fold metallo-hydrolase [Streptomyces turgidiscabies]GAQ75388.1 hydroxyacylglutathione hydrolase [Streptomyces turgidiscabies]
MADLTYDVYVSDGVPRARAERLPDGGPIVSSPLASTLIIGEREAVLVDPPFTREQTQAVGDWVERSGKRLAYIYATHGHGDHWFGTGELLERFPGAVPYATEGTIGIMRRNVQGREQFWDADFPGLIPDSPLVYRPVPADGFELEGHRIEVVEVGHTDTDDTTVLHVPSIGLIVGGDVVYNGVHQMLLETPGGGFESWLAALDVLDSLNPRSVVAGHKNRDLPDDPAIIDETRQYLRDAQRLLAEKPIPQQFFDEITARYPDRLNIGPVWYGAHGLLGVPLPAGPAGDANQASE